MRTSFCQRQARGVSDTVSSNNSMLLGFPHKFRDPCVKACSKMLLNDVDEMIDMLIKHQ